MKINLGISRKEISVQYEDRTLGAHMVPKEMVCIRRQKDAHLCVQKQYGQQRTSEW